MKLAALILTTAFLAAGQTNPTILDFNHHAWVSYSGEHAVKGKWGLHFDAQWRRSDLGTEWQQYQIRPGLNYEWNKNVLLTLGYVYTRSYPYGDYPLRKAFPEHRVYQQARIQHKASGLQLQHRIRLEQRLIQYPNSDPAPWTYQNRFRYLLKADIPIKGNWYLPVYDEILFGIPPNIGARTFDQNRIFAGVGYRMPKANVEVGYLNQFLGQRNGRIFEANNTLFVTVTSNFSFADYF